MANYQRLVASLRQAGIAAELYLGSGGMNAQLKYADRRRSRVAVIQGSNERNATGGPQVTIRDLKLGAELGEIDQGPRRLSGAAAARPIPRARGGVGRAGARGAGEALGGLLLNGVSLYFLQLTRALGAVDHLDFLGRCAFRCQSTR